MDTLKVTAILLLVVCCCTACRDEPMEDPRFDGVVYAPTPYLLSYPDRFPQPEIPADNPLTEEGVQLGRRLFYDPLLHASGEQACAGCHQQSLAFTSDGPVLPHINLGWNSAFLWDGKVQGTLEDIMLFEVKEFFAADMDRFNAHATYPVLFYEAFGEKVVTHEMAAMALAQFQRTMISGNSRYDRFMNGEIFLTDDEYDGLEIFFTERGDCFHCHGGVLFTDNMFHNNALDADPEQGLARNTGLSQDIGKFKSPTLRNIALTAPYMHDGRYATLGDVINFYSEGLQNSETVDPLMKQLHRGGIQLTMREKEALIAFLHCLTDTSFIQNSALSSPF